MGNDYFTKYLSYADKEAIKFAKKRGLEADDIIQDARMALLNVSKKYSGDASSFEKYLQKALYCAFKKAAITYSAIRYPDYIAGHINFISRVFDKNKTFKDNVDFVKNALNLSIETAENEVSYFLNIYNANNKTFLDEEQFMDLLVKQEKEKIFREYSKDCRKKNIIIAINRICNSREADIILRKFGFYGEPETLSAISQDYGVSSIRAGQIYKRRMEKLSSHFGKSIIKNALENSF